MYIKGKEVDFDNFTFSHNFIPPDVTQDEWKGFVKEWGTGSISFTARISEEDNRKLYQYLTGRYLPSTSQKWQYHRQILNPHYTKYRKYLRTYHDTRSYRIC